VKGEYGRQQMMTKLPGAWGEGNKGEKKGKRNRSFWGQRLTVLQLSGCYDHRGEKGKRKRKRAGSVNKKWPKVPIKRLGHTKKREEERRLERGGGVQERAFGWVNKGHQENTQKKATKKRRSEGKVSTTLYGVCVAWKSSD